MVAAFVWDETFLTGVESVDQQHHELFNLINRLSESLIQGEVVAESTIASTFDALRDYARYHFTEEEELMCAVGIDPRHLNYQRSAHLQFIEQIDSLWNCRGAMSNPAEIILGFLSSWLAQHILGVDQSMARQIRRIRAGETASRAYELDILGEDVKEAMLLKAMDHLYHALSRQNRDLAAANLGLEQRVRERTHDLQSANAELTQANLRLAAFARMDGFLGIANRQSFDELFGQEWLRARREKMPLSLLMIDVDNFKRYNDAYGHQAGDCCLQRIVKAAQSVLLRPGDLLARYGGEEFVVFLPNTREPGALVIAQKICAQVQALQIAHRDSSAAPVVTVSVGVASEAAGAAGSPEALIARADEALYRAKAQGRNRVCAAENGN